MNGPIGCCLRNFAPSSVERRSTAQSLRSAPVIFRRRRFALSSVSLLYPVTPSPFSRFAAPSLSLKGRGDWARLSRLVERDKGEFPFGDECFLVAVPLPGDGFRFEAQRRAPFL